MVPDRAPRVRDPEAQRQRAIGFDGGDAALAPRRLVLAADDEELVDARRLPVAVPLGVAPVTVAREIELGTEQAARAEAQPDTAGDVIALQAAKPRLKRCQAPPLLMQRVRARSPLLQACDHRPCP